MVARGRLSVALVLSLVVSGCAFAGSVDEEAKALTPDELPSMATEQTPRPNLVVEGGRYSIGDVAMTIDLDGRQLVLELPERTVTLNASLGDLADQSTEVQRAAPLGAVVLQVDASDVEFSTTEQAVIAELTSQAAAYQPPSDVAGLDGQSASCAIGVVVAGLGVAACGFWCAAGGVVIRGVGLLRLIAGLIAQAASDCRSQSGVRGGTAPVAQGNAEPGSLSWQPLSWARRMVR